MANVVVFDTNILFSATGWQGKPYRCVELARDGSVTGVTCREILDELAEKLQGKLNFSAEMVTDTVADLLGFLRLIPIPKTLTFISAVQMMMWYWNVQLLGRRLHCYG
ncbi:MAG: PIN domain-containing protein [Chloroflexi bacterium]|nr:PIN domain-containing protein [Chloroflexota bacterium]